MKRTLIALFAPLLIWQATAFAQSQPSLLSEKQLASAEKLITKLEGFEAFTQSQPGPREYRDRLQGISSSIYISASKLPESNLKTNIATALHFYESAAPNRNDPTVEVAGGAGCVNEKPGAYQRLCEANSGSRSQLLWAKARLHLNWASALVRPTVYAEENAPLLRDIELELRTDQQLAERAFNALRVLQREVVIHSSLADFEETETLGHVPYETFKEDLRRTSIEVERILAWLPQNRLKFEISNALYSYQDGGLGWSRIYQPRVVKISELSSLEMRSASFTALQARVPYTVAINWRQAGKYLARVEDLIGRPRGQRDDSAVSSEQ